ncbi:hypothetical protein NQ317_017819 [Molorchus minor]|uniref:TGF-beta propeptide domain-containing protein n=1 Tax=Molorchus minor TaxID=1323400 RepID=A0ABQ9K2F3_9CUCU|nr:hypothetical protein NQ317_017819 [Molorchus minor]
MCFETRTLIYLACLVLWLNSADTAPRSQQRPVHPKNPTDLESTVEHFLNLYYEDYLNGQLEEERKRARSQAEDGRDMYETMQGDQPVAGNNINQNPGAKGNASTIVIGGRFTRNFTDQYLEAVRNRSKENFIQFLKKNILEHLGRTNATMPPTPEDVRLSSFNMSQILFNMTNTLNDDNITEKSELLPLIEHRSGHLEGRRYNELILQFHNGSSLNSRVENCDTFNSTDDERLLRVSIYWYTKSLKRRRVKRRLSDSKVIPLYARWVELSVKPATKAWARGRNLGLGVHVEDQEGNTLRADRYFKGATCTPIPTIIIDTVRRSNEHNGGNSGTGGNSTSTVYSDVHLLPTIDICTLEFPDNYTQPPHLMNLRIKACNLKKMHELSQKLEEKDHLERLATLPEYLLPSSRHIRHQRQYLANKKNEEREFDPRSRIVGSTIVLTNEEWQNYTNKLNISTVDR